MLNLSFQGAAALLLSCGSALFDLRTGEIPNRWLLCCLLTGLLLSFSDPSGSLALPSSRLLLYRIAGLLLPLLFPGLLFLTGAIGAGDVKLFCVLGFLMGFPDILYCIFLSFFAGAIISVPLLIAKAHRQRWPAARTSTLRFAAAVVPAVILWAAGLYGEF